MPMDDDVGRGRTSAGYQGQGRGSGVTDARPSPGGGNTGGSGNAGGGGNRDRQNDSGSDSGSGSYAKQTAKENERRQAEANQRAADDARAKATQDAVDRERQKAADDARAKATQDAVDRDRIQAALAEGMRQSELQRVAAGIASLRGVPLPKVQEAAVVNRKSVADFRLDQNPANTGSVMQGSGAMSPPVSPVAPTTTLDFRRANEILSSSQGGQYDPTSGGMIPNADMLKGYIKLSGATGDQTTTRNSMLEGFSKDYLTKMLGSLAKTSGDVSIGSARRSPEEQASIISDRLREIDPKVATDWDKSVSEKGAIAAGQEFKDLFDIAGYFKTPGEQVAMPGSSQHQKSAAMDIAFGGGGAAREDLINRFQTTATGQGLSFPVKGEYWHAELAGDRPTQVATSPFVRDLNKTFDNIKAGVKTVADATGAGSVLDFLTNKSLRDEIVRDNNRDRQMTSEEVNIAMFNRLHPEAGSNKELYGGRDQVNPLVRKKPVLPPVVPPVVPTEPVPPPVAPPVVQQRYTGTPTVATQGFDFSRPFAPRPPMDFANLGQAYAPTALSTAPTPEPPVPGVPGAAYAIPYQRLG